MRGAHGELCGKLLTLVAAASWVCGQVSGVLLVGVWKTNLSIFSCSSFRQKYSLSEFLLDYSKVKQGVNPNPPADQVWLRCSLSI